VKMFRNMHRK